MLNINTGQNLKTLKGHTDEISRVRVLDHYRVVSCSVDKSIRIWEIASGEYLKDIQTKLSLSHIELLSTEKIAVHIWSGHFSKRIEMSPKASHTRQIRRDRIGSRHSCDQKIVKRTSNFLARRRQIDQNLGYEHQLMFKKTDCLVR